MNIQGSFRQELECVLTDSQIKTYSAELARLTQEQAELEDRKKEVTAGYKARIDACISSTRVVARKVATGKEMRDVDVRWELDFDSNAKYLFRLDTYQVVDTKPLTEDERQMCLKLETKAEGEQESIDPEDVEDAEDAEEGTDEQPEV